MAATDKGRTAAWLSATLGGDRRLTAGRGAWPSPWSKANAAR